VPFSSFELLIFDSCCNRRELARMRADHDEQFKRLSSEATARANAERAALAAQLVPFLSSLLHVQQSICYLSFCDFQERETAVLLERGETQLREEAARERDLRVAEAQVSTYVHRQLILTSYPSVHQICFNTTGSAGARVAGTPTPCAVAAFGGSGPGHCSTQGNC
jgi:hypothetical protein